MIKDNFLEETSHCSTDSTFYHCMAKMLNPENTTCPKVCTPFLKKEYISLIETNTKWPTCQSQSDDNCISMEWWKKYKVSHNKCSNSCYQTTYHGTVSSVEWVKPGNENSTGLVIIFASKDVVERNETLAFGTTAIIGSVGGTLGLFIGFSFYGLLMIPFAKLLLISTE